MRARQEHGAERPLRHRRQAPGGRPGVKNPPKPAWRGHHTGNSREGRNQAGIGVTRLAAEYGMLEVMIESQENPSENPADAEGRSESGVDPSGAASQERGSNPRTSTERRVPITPILFEPKPPRPEALIRVLSRVCEDRDEVDAVVEEIEGRLGHRVRIAIKALEAILVNDLQSQRESLDAQQVSIREQCAATWAQTARIDAQTARIDAQGREIGSLAREIRVHDAEIRVNGSRSDALDERVDALGKEIGSLKTEV